MNNPASMRAPHERPLTECKENVSCSCGEVLAINDPENERERQALLWGTTKWTDSYNRRTAVEREYADNKFQVTGFSRGSIRCFGTVKQAVYYTPVIVARNLQVALRWYRDQGQPSPWPLDEISRPDYKLPKELGGLHLIEAEHDLLPAAEAEEAVVQPSSAATVTDSGGGDVPEELAEVPNPGLNRRQRRAAQRRTGRRAQTSKPPKPPPDGSKPAGQ